jgi:hypothetical protein
MKRLALIPMLESGGMAGILALPGLET